MQAVIKGTLPSALCGHHRSGRGHGTGHVTSFGAEASLMDGDRSRDNALLVLPTSECHKESIGLPLAPLASGWILMVPPRI